MLLPRALLFASTLSLLPTVQAQDLLPSVTSNQGELRFTLGELMVRRWDEAGVAKAARSRDGGRSWQPLADPDDRLHFRLAQYDPLRGDVQLPGVLGAPVGNRLFLVQFPTQILAEYRTALEARGVEILHYLPENALFVRCDHGAAAALRSLPWIRWVGDLQNGFKLDDALTAFLLSGSEEPLECNLVLAAKADRARLVRQIGDVGGTVTHDGDGGVYVVAKLTAAQLQGVLALDTVTWADPTPEVGTDMDNARIQGGANYVESRGGFNGTGVRAEITEGLDQTHPDWTLPVLIRRDTNDTHGHCTAGIVAGNGSGNAAARGVIPNAQVIENSYIALGAAEHYARVRDSVNPALQWRAMQATASWGAATTTLYTSVSQAMDDALFDFDFVRTQSQSNTNNQNSRPEAWAKNSISVGGLRHQDNANPADDVWNGASIGPASDGRLKPDICAYYEAILCSDRPGTAGYNTAAGVAGNYYASFGGTSGATPIVNGYCGLIQQMFTDGLFHNPLPLPATAANRFDNRPHMSTVKALLCNTGAQYTFSGTGANLSRVKQGWGFPDVARLYDNRDKILVVDEYVALQQGQARTWLVWVAPGTPEFRATMVYTDPEAQANAAIHRVNNADLKVTNLATGTFWWGNNGLAAGNFSTAGGVANDRDTIECVYLQNPAAGIYLVQVSAPSIVQDAKVETPQLDLDFALAVHPVGGGYHNGSTIDLDVVSNAPGSIVVNANNVPANGWTDGFTFFSFDTFGPKGFGGFFGMQDDFITGAIFQLPAAAGDVFHFTNTPGQYPFAPYAFPPATALALSGLTVDAMVTLFAANGTIFAQSNVDRVLIQ